MNPLGGERDDRYLEALPRFEIERLVTPVIPLASSASRFSDAMRQLSLIKISAVAPRLNSFCTRQSRLDVPEIMLLNQRPSFELS